MTAMAEQCEALIYKRDTYRRTGRGKSGFSMHYEKCRCSRGAVENGFCAQHAKADKFGYRPTRCDYLPLPKYDSVGAK